MNTKHFFCFRHKEVDMIIIREQTEGEYTSLEHEVCNLTVWKGRDRGFCISCLQHLFVPVPAPPVLFPASLKFSGCKYYALLQKMFLFLPLTALNFSAFYRVVAHLSPGFQPSCPTPCKKAPGKLRIMLISVMLWKCKDPFTM